MQCRDHSTNQQQTLSLTLCSESLACGTAWTSTAEERWAAPAGPGQRAAGHGIWDDGDGADGAADLAGAPLTSTVVARAREGMASRHSNTHNRGSFLFFHVPRLGHRRPEPVSGLAPANPARTWSGQTHPVHPSETKRYAPTKTTICPLGDLGAGCADWAGPVPANMLESTRGHDGCRCAGLPMRAQCSRSARPRSRVESRRAVASTVRERPGRDGVGAGMPVHRRPPPPLAHAQPCVWLLQLTSSSFIQALGEYEAGWMAHDGAAHAR
ncbi:hypothetical protein P171DRAFT_243931 [Karstenula rhodostoma CBS 690.94]|uniref:Uncharacterized protein n=1 Tax=Karstenula rhodostoma CBS 690.94 TaxID=1392251 RepID=A0A9P4UCS3_9PLEO|nr:hypothetical protein P171DRAFT_243931 [Karstenula rhodostoma CBS 690.94]